MSISYPNYKSIADAICEQIRELQDQLVAALAKNAELSEALTGVILERNKLWGQRDELEQRIKESQKYRADFLFGFDEESVEEAGYEFINAATEEGRQQWWINLCERICSAPVISENKEEGK